MKQMNPAQKAALLGVFGALALALSFLEHTLMPAVPLLPPGAKLGLSNIVTVVCGALFGPPAAFYIAALKALFAFVTRGATAGLMSLAGGLLSAAALSLLLRQIGRTVSYLGVGVLCAAAHNLGQLLMSVCLTGSPALLSYGKYLLLFALLTGTLTGLMLCVLVPRLQKSGRFSSIKIGQSKEQDQ